MSQAQPIPAPAPPGAETEALTAQIRRLVGMLGAVASAIDEAGDRGLSAEERELVDAILHDARQTIVALGALIELSPQPRP
jgi:hypothetical protein